MQKLEILLLGPPVVRWNDELMSIQRRLPRALLFYLAWQGKMVARETVLNLFWGADISNNRPRLNESLSRLRSAFPLPDFIISQDDLIGLDFNQVYVDHSHFENLIDQAGRVTWQTPEEEPLPPDIYQLLTEANELWRGLFPLQGIAFPTPELDSWMSQGCDRMCNLRCNVLKRLSDHAYVMQDLPTALDLAYTALKYNEIDEDLHFKVMRNLVKMGRLNEARQYFEETQAMLGQELGIRPPAKMIHIYQQIRRQKRDCEPDIDPIWEIHPGMDVPFVGRQNALQKMHQIIEENRGLVIMGESGQGKSRLMREFILRLEPQPRVLTSICRPMENTLSFRPIIELLRRYVTPDEWLSLSPVWANYLTGLLPELTQMRDDLNPVTLLVDSDQSQARIFESIRQVLTLMCENRPIFLVLDDAHWADEATLATISYLLVRPPFTTSASLALIARLEDLSEALDKMLVSIQQSKHASVYKLGRLRRKDVVSLTHYQLNKIPPEHFIDRLMADTGGNTFFVLETLRAIIDTKGKLPDSVLPLTENLQNLIQSRIQQLSAKSRETLEVAAVIGSEFSIQVLGRTILQHPEELAPMLEELESKLLIRSFEQRKGQFYYRFTHDKIREALLASLQPAKAQLLHTKIVQALNKLPEQPAILAHHYHGAGELKLAFQYWIRAAERSRAFFAKEDAFRDYAYAEQLLEQIEAELDDQEIYKFYADWSDLAYNVNEPTIIKRNGNALIRIGEQRASHMLIGSGLNILSDACMTVNDFEAGLDLANRAISHLEQSDNAFEHIEAYNHQGTFLYMLNRLEEALLSFQDALALSTEGPDLKTRKARSNAHYQTALLQTLSGKPISGYEHAVKAFEIGELSKHTYVIVQAYSIKSLSQFYMGEFAQARENALQGIELAQRIQGWRMLGYLHSYAAMSAISLGYLDSGRKHAEEAIQLGEKNGHYDIVALGYRQLGELHRLLSDYKNAAQYYQCSIDVVGEHFIGLDNLYRLGLCQHFQGQKDGVNLILQARTMLENNAVGVGVIAAKICQALVFASSNAYQELEPLACELESETLSKGLASFHINTTILLGEVALAKGDSESALDHFRFAAGEAQFMKNPWLEIKAQVAIEQVLQNQAADITTPKDRIEILINQLEQQVSHPETRQAFSHFRQQISARKQIFSDPL